MLLQKKTKTNKYSNHFVLMKALSPDTTSYADMPLVDRLLRLNEKAIDT
jgi:hypothetical protein